MRRHVPVALVVALGVAMFALGGQKFWQKKDFPDWSKKEVRQMLTKSPWARSLTVRLDDLQDSGSERDGGSGAGAGGGVGQPEGSYPSGAGGYPGPRGGAGGGGFAPSLNLTVRWYSALPIKQALATQHYGSEAQADENLKRRETHYTIGLSGIRRALFRGDPNFSKSGTGSDPWEALSERLKSESFLKLSGRELIPAVDVQMRSAPGSDAADAGERGGGEILMAFPRSRIITLEDKQVEFVTVMGRHKLKKKFKLKDMVYNGKLEL